MSGRLPYRSLRHRCTVGGGVDLCEILPHGQDFFITRKGDLSMKQKAQIMDGAAMSRVLARITHEIIERNQGATELCLL